MSYITISAPGSKLGPCDPAAECGHEDCEFWVLIANASCPICKQALGYERRITKDDQRRYVHQTCVERVEWHKAHPPIIVAEEESPEIPPAHLRPRGWLADPYSPDDPAPIGL